MVNVFVSHGLSIFLGLFQVFVMAYWKAPFRLKYNCSFVFFPNQPALYSAIRLWMYIRNVSNDHFPFFFPIPIVSRKFSDIAPPALKECDITQLLVIPWFSRPSETMALLIFTRMSSSVTWYFVPLSKWKQINSFFSALLSQRCKKRRTKAFTGNVCIFIGLRWTNLPQIPFFDYLTVKLLQWLGITWIMVHLLRS